MFVSIDDYYDVDFYNDSLMALEENGVQFTEHILFKDKIPKFCIELPREPLMIHHNVVPLEHEKYLVSKVIPLDVNSSFTLYRKRVDFGKGIRPEMYLNDALSSIEQGKYAAFVDIKSQEEAIALSKEIPLRIYFLGKYLNRYKVCLITSDYFIPKLKPSQILLELSEKSSVVRFEQDFNFRILQRKDRLVKYSKTPYFENGVFFKPRNLTNPRFITF